MIQSTEASNAIENIHAPRARIEALVAEKTTPKNRSEQEIAGYRDVLGLIHANQTNIPFEPRYVEQLHGRSAARPGSVGSVRVVPTRLALSPDRARHE